VTAKGPSTRAAAAPTAVETVDCVVVGAGVVGLAVARALARAGREVVVVEKAEAIGTETSSRNSEVIHAGIYYPTGSLKAELCVAGKQALYRYCAARGIAARACGKLIVAAEESQLGALEALRRKAAANGVDDLVLLDPPAVRRLEPAVVAAGALLSPSTGIVDSHAFMLSLQGDAEAAGAVFAFLSPVLGGVAGEDGIALDVAFDGGGASGGTLRLAARAVVNAAGLGAVDLARALDGLAPDRVPRYHLAKGNYYTARFGPDVEWVDAVDYDVDPRRAEAFYAAVRRYWPDLPDGALQPDYAGVRPKLQAPGAPARDFMIQGPADHGIPGLINLYGIESPGLTASLAIAGRVAALLKSFRI
jgi:L-2-hydroxyglutarate oxidase LhgO